MTAKYAAHRAKRRRLLQAGFQEMKLEASVIERVAYGSSQSGTETHDMTGLEVWLAPFVLFAAGALLAFMALMLFDEYRKASWLIR